MFFVTLMKKTPKPKVQILEYSFPSQNIRKVTLTCHSVVMQEQILKEQFHSRLIITWIGTFFVFKLPVRPSVEPQVYGWIQRQSNVYVVGTLT